MVFSAFSTLKMSSQRTILEFSGHLMKPLATRLNRSGFHKMPENSICACFADILFMMTGRDHRNSTKDIGNSKKETQKEGRERKKEARNFGWSGAGGPGLRFRFLGFGLGVYLLRTGVQSSSGQNTKTRVLANISLAKVGQTLKH